MHKEKNNEIKAKSIVIVTRNMLAGGAERVISQLANYFVENEIVCNIVTLDCKEVQYEIDNRIKIIPIGKKSSNKGLDKFFRYSRLRKILLEQKPDVVLAMPEEIGIYVLLAMLGTSIPVYVSERNNPWVMPDQKITRILRTLMYPFATRLIFQTEMAKSYFSEKIQKKGIVLNNPVDASRIPKQYCGEREKVIVAAGRLAKQKNFELLIRSFSEFHKEHSDYKMIIYGEGKMRSELENLIKELKLDSKITLPGIKTNLLQLINSAAMFVLSSDYEGMPNVLLEAMCMGMPVISTDCPSGGPRQLIENGVNGLLVPVNDIMALSDAMDKMTCTDNAKFISDNAYKIREVVVSDKIFKDWEQYLFSANS